MAKKKRTPEQEADRKLTIKSTVIVLSIIAIGVPVMWYIMDWLATERVVMYTFIEKDGRELTLTLSEKTNGGGNRSTLNSPHHDNVDRGPTHHGYFLELYDSAANQSLHKIKFDSPVHTIQSTPEIRVVNDSVIWVVSVTNTPDDDKRGFILKFAIQNNQIIEQNFKLDEFYKIRKLDDYKVVLSEGNDIFGDFIDPIYGGLYFDLKTEKMVDTRTKYESSETEEKEYYVP